MSYLHSLSIVEKGLAKGGFNGIVEADLDVYCTPNTMQFGGHKQARLLGMRRRRAATRLITSVVVSVVETHALFVYASYQNLWVLVLTCNVYYYKYYAVAVNSSKRTG